MTSPRATLHLNFSKIRDDLYLNKPLDLTPMLQALRACDKECVDKLLALGYRFEWIDPVSKKNVMRTLVETGDVKAIDFFLHLPDIQPRDHLLDLIQGAMVTQNPSILQRIKMISYFFVFDEEALARKMWIAKVAIGERSIEDAANDTRDIYELGNILFHLALNGNARTAIQLLEKLVIKSQHVIFRNGNSTFTPNQQLKEKILQDRLYVLRRLLLGAAHDDQFNLEELQPLCKALNIEMTNDAYIIAAEAFAAAGKIDKARDVSKKDAEAMKEVICNAMRHGHFRSALKLCDQARELNSADAYFKLLHEVFKSTIYNKFTIFSKLILRRFPDDYVNKYDLETYFKPEDEDVKKLFLTKNDPIYYLLAIQILYPRHADYILREFQNKLGIPHKQMLTPRELQLLFADRALIQFILLRLDNKYLAFTHDIHDRLMGEISSHQHPAEHLKLFKQVVRQNMPMFRGVIRKKPPESYENFSEYLEKYNSIRLQLRTYLDKNSSCHLRKASMIFLQIERAKTIKELQTILHEALNPRTYYGFYEFTFSRLWRDDLKPVLTSCLAKAHARAGNWRHLQLNN